LEELDYQGHYVKQEQPEVLYLTSYSYLKFTVWVSKWLPSDILGSEGKKKRLVISLTQGQQASVKWVLGPAASS
jgi:hypothetical protein